MKKTKPKTKPKYAKGYDDQCSENWKGKNKLVSFCCQLVDGHDGAHITWLGKRWLTK